jgi:hypothetical protein
MDAGLGAAERARAKPGAQAHAHALAQAVALDMATCWQPTAKGKERILEALPRSS